MSNYTPITLNATINTFDGFEKYDEQDQTELANIFQKYSVIIDQIQEQQLGDASTRESYLYNGLDIRVGMYVSDSEGKTILKIDTIKKQTSTSIKVILKDVDMLSYRINNKNTIATQSDVAIFDTNDNGEAIIADTSIFSGRSVDIVQSRFQFYQKGVRVKFTHDQSPNINLGDIVTIDSNGNLVPHGDSNAISDIKVGTVVDSIRNEKDIFINPFNSIIEDYKNPELLTGSPGTIYYNDKYNPGKIIPDNGDQMVYLHLNTSIKTTINAENEKLPDSTQDVVNINGVTVFDYNNGDSVSSLSDWVNLINNYSNQTNVDAKSEYLTAYVQSDVNKLAYAGYWSENDVFIATNKIGDSAVYGEISISDGNNSANIIFDNPDEIVTINGSDYNVISPTAIRDKIDNVINNNSLDLKVELINLVNGNGQGIKISTINNATELSLNNISNGLFNKSIIGNPSWIGIPSNSSDDGDSTTAVKIVEGPYLFLERTSGGPINITGEPISGGYINNAGIVSSYNGRIPYLLLIEDLNSIDAKYGVHTNDDTNQIPNNTNGDYQSTGVTISHQPFSDSRVDVLVNGINVQVGNGTRNAPCYFSPQGDGSFARQISNIEAGDELFWMGSQIGYDLENTDIVDIEYQVPKS